MSYKFSSLESTLLQDWIILPGKIPPGVGVDGIDSSSPLLKYESGGNSKLRLNIPIISAPMQSVTGSNLMKALAAEGGLGVTYRSQTSSEEAEMVREVKDYKAGFVVPDVFSVDATIVEVDMRIKERGYSTFPITDNGQADGKLIGYITRKDFYYPKHKELKVGDRMVPVERITLAHLEDVLEYGQPSLNKANEILIESHHGSLPIVDEEGRLRYVVFKKDIDDKLNNPRQLLDSKRRLVCGAAIDTRDYKERSKLLVDAEADVLFIDTSQAISDYVKDCLRYIKVNYPDTPVVGGNIITPEGFRFLVDNGADAVKIGMGSGSICITQEQIRVGRGQATAIIDVSKERDRYLKKCGVYVPLVSDGGIITASDMTVALALGADSVMCGKYLAGADESSTEIMTRKSPDGLEERVKPYWGEGSIKAREWSGARYGHPGTDFEEGFETTVPYVGSLKPYILKAMTMVRDGIRKGGCRSIPDLHKNAKLERLSQTMLSVSRDKRSNIR